METFAPYLEHLKSLLVSATTPTGRIGNAQEIVAVLDGQPARELRRRVNLDKLRESGAFFTGSKLSKLALSRLFQTFSADSTITDPACGAGDLLIACSPYLPRGKNLEHTIDLWSSRLYGRDIHPEFIDVAKARLLLAALMIEEPSSRIELPDLDSIFPNLKVASGLTDMPAIQEATHIVINPPFTPMRASAECSWGSGLVNSAAIFLETCIAHASPGTKVAAILPDVLRSGSRYLKWRKLIETHANIQYVHIHGLFDRATDVDVFFLELEVAEKPTETPKGIWNSCQDAPPSLRVGDLFSIQIGPVVDYRDPRKGPWLPFFNSRDLPPWGSISQAPRKRRFTGKSINPPFVAVRRTSRPGDSYRAVGTIISEASPVAIENHLIALSPKDGRLKTCAELLSILRRPETNQWLNQHICCRHLTVGSLRELPWWTDE